LFARQAMPATRLLQPPLTYRHGGHRVKVPRCRLPLARGRSEMDRRIVVVLYVLAMAAVIVGVDYLFLRNRFWERLIVNIGIVLVFGAFYLKFFMHP
jgi:hypothetical protein